MSYNSNHLKWQAFKYKDPFASDKFFVCNSKLNICCRPNCDLSFNYGENISDEIIFFDSKNDVIKNGYQLCQHCLPNLKKNSEILSNENYVLIDLNLLSSTIKNVNKKIGFIPPLFENTRKSYINAINQLRNNKLKNKLLQYTNLTYNINDNTQAFQSNPKVNPSKSDLEHLKLIDMACKHIALAALSTVFGLQLIYNNNAKEEEGEEEEEEEEEESEEVLEQRSHNTLNPFDNDDDYDEKFDNDDNDDNISDIDDSFHFSNNQFQRGSFIMKHLKLKTKKRRGGVLGFKELASKSQLSPWHFHRTFKSMTGITPKQYGDKCFKYLDFKKDQLHQSLNDSNSIIINAKLANPSFISNNELISTTRKSSIVSTDSEINDLNDMTELTELTELDELNPLNEISELNYIDQDTQIPLDCNSSPDTHSKFNSYHLLSSTLTTPTESDFIFKPNTPISLTSLSSTSMFNHNSNFSSHSTNCFDANYSLNSPQKLPQFSDNLKPDRFYYMNNNAAKNNQYSKSDSDLLLSSNSHISHSNNNNGNNNNFSEFYNNLNASESLSILINNPTGSDIDNQLLIKQLQLQNLLEKRINDQQVNNQQDSNNFFINTLLDDNDIESSTLGYFNISDLNMNLLNN